MSPPPRMLHERVQMRLTRAIGNYLDREPVGEAFGRSELSPGPDTLVEPDLIVIRQDEANTLDWSRITRPLLVVEILSPSSIKADRGKKRELYQQIGVAVYWIVDADARLVEVWTPEATSGVVERVTLRWHPAGASDALEMSLDALFAG